MKRVIAAIIIAILAFALGAEIGRNCTIRQAELIGVAEDEYCIAFGDEIHAYTYDSEVK